MFDKIDKTEKKFRYALALYYFVFQFALNLTFGVLLIKFRNDDNYNDACDSDDFKNWVLAASIILFIICGKAFCITFAGPKVQMGMDACFSFVILIVTIGTHATADSSCAQLFKLVQGFSIVQYLLIVFKIFGVIKLCDFSDDK